MTPTGFHDTPPQDLPASNPPKIRIVRVRAVDRGNLKGFADVQLGGVLVRDFRIIQQAGHRPWVSPPQRSWEGDDGKPYYAAIVELSDTLKPRVERAILAAWQAEEGRHAHP
jgi:hypothetical protein